MTMLDTIQSLSGGPMGYAALVGALGYAIKQGANALKTRSAAKSARIVADAEAEKARAEATRVAAEVDAQNASITAEMLERYEARLTASEKLIGELRDEVDTLRRAMRKAGIPTPPRGFPKASPAGFTAPEAAPNDNPDPQMSGPHR